MAHEKAHHEFLKSFIAKVNDKKLLGGKLNESHIPTLKNATSEHFVNLMNHLSSGGAIQAHKIPVGIQHNENEGKTSILGGTIHIGGALENENWLSTASPREMYHYLLLSNPHHIELMREIASQITGGHPSPMWGRVVPKNTKMEAPAEGYEEIIRMPNGHAMARYLDMEHHNMGGGSFSSALRHVGKVAKNVYKFGHSALGWAQKNKEAISKLPGLQQYAPQINQALDTASKYDALINPLVESASKAATGQPANESERPGLKEAAKQSIEEIKPKPKISSDQPVEAVRSEDKHGQHNKKSYD